ncbi:dTDP-4-dehydrorhamnose 3,5-epimerase [Mesonia ostreae]|uniref:dTDP-4-dehydrorhamnose 3,5-epimerase n=1 Tax=Mesonia ostreae TaxID=861110 RepID=A0ABU2KH79_9FLAO|nr:dTDP-4-dehydrorhamnose 3,5-epimerase [Mesonia ostreae]MDT0294049.1 dTDP-4-dehydrorhamnose 3,5-epimerase [Mesonia ostreae]
MEFIRTEIPDVVICKPQIFGDHRGYFTETYRKDKLEEFLGYKVNFCQDNESKSSYGVLRGMHYQKPPFTQSKLVRVIEGRVLDVAVDMRKGSPHFGKSVAIELNAKDGNQLFVPRGFAHGFIVLSATATFAYKCDNYYAPNYDTGFLYNDESLNIDWQVPENDLLLSEKDKKQPPFSQAEVFDINKNLYD